MLHYAPQHVSSSTLLILRRTNYITTASGIVTMEIGERSHINKMRSAVHITLSSTPDQQVENHSTKYHRQQPLYNTLELLMMGIVVPETC